MTTYNTLIKEHNKNKEDIIEINGQLADIVVSVKNFGAKGDGVNNDTDAINTAQLSGNSLYFPKGIYLVDYFNITNNNIKITADKEAILKANNIINGFVKISASNVNIDNNLILDCNNKASTGLIIKDGSEDVCIECTILNVFSSDFIARGIHVEGNTDNIVINGCKIDNIVSTPNSIEGDNQGGSRAIAIMPSTLGTEIAPRNITIKNCVITHIQPREDGDAISISGWSDTDNIIIKDNYFNYCSKRAFKIASPNVQILNNTIINPYIGASENNYKDCMFSFASIFADNVTVKGNRFIGGNVQIAIEISITPTIINNITIKDNEINIATTGIRPAYGLVYLQYGVTNSEISGNTLINGLYGLQGRGTITNTLVANNIIKNATSKGMIFETTNYVVFSDINIVGNKINATQYGMQFGNGQFVVTGNDGISGWEFISIVTGASVILQGNKDDTYVTLPTPSVFYRGKTIVVRGDTTYDDRVYSCVKLANSNTYSWKQLTIN
ncbi:glycosyl hydrolase family 28-related protein [uncultured Clostridium sp.]|uniref:glycosyl hydrolase family 28-related protein n=1 Tax=uncultured Clostridium sp. TaxID=59620 RepID=UPI00321745ED